ncbi:hypothetical protein SRHO_G00118640 [Serrasalmus rhombeus]
MGEEGGAGGNSREWPRRTTSPFTVKSSELSLSLRTGATTWSNTDFMGLDLPFGGWDFIKTASPSSSGFSFFGPAPSTFSTCGFTGGLVLVLVLEGSPRHTAEFLAETFRHSSENLFGRVTTGLGSFP